MRTFEQHRRRILQDTALLGRLQRADEGLENLLAAIIVKEDSERHFHAAIWLRRAQPNNFDTHLRDLFCDLGIVIGHRVERRVESPFSLAPPAGGRGIIDDEARAS